MRYVVALALLVAAPAEAHVGVVLAQARFSSPPGPKVTPIDMGVAFDNTYPWLSADQTFNVAWDDGDNDPTGNFSFYYFDHQPTFQLLAIFPNNLSLLTPIAAATGDVAHGEQPVAIFAGCVCNPDGGVGGAPIVCPDAGAMRDCRNSFSWDTSGVPAGSYWIVAMNNDDPFHIASVSNGPVRVQHGGAPLPPAVMVLRPDGFNSFDKSYRVQWAATGTPPLHFDLAYGLDDAQTVMQPPIPLATDVQAITNPDGTWSWDWDISALVTLKDYYLRITVTDGNGTKAYTDSRYGLSVYHPNSDGGSQAPPDLSVLQLMPNKSGCSESGAAVTPIALVPLALLALLVLVLVRRRA